MVLDTSAVVAILEGEPERDRFAELIADEPDPVISAATLVESRLVMHSKRGPEGAKALDDLLRAGGVRVIAFNEAQADLAHAAWAEFGKGRHPAGLNLGDCFSYALAKALDRPLLYKGDDFAQATEKWP